MVETDSHAKHAVLAKHVSGHAEPEQDRVAGIGTRSITASPIDLTRVPPAGSWTSTAAQKASTTATACSSPCASVNAVNPAMSANRNVAGVSLMVATR